MSDTIEFPVPSGATKAAVTFSVTEPAPEPEPTPEPVSDAEHLYWRDRAASLDPAAYVHYRGQTVTVPADATWYAMNLWWVRSGASWGFLRRADANAMLMLPAGTVIQATGNSNQGFAYICQPELVVGDPRYDNPRALYYERLARLRTLPLQVLGLPTQRSGQQHATLFPATVDRALITAVSTFDLAWTVLGSAASINTLNELGDGNQQIRFSEAVMIPFTRSVFDRIRVKDAGLFGQSAVWYHELPEDW